MRRTVSAPRTPRWGLAAASMAGFAFAIATGPAQSQPPEEITITAPYVLHEEVGRSATGGSIERLTLTRQVSYADLDLTQPADADELERRVTERAKEACKQLDGLYPLLPSDPDCVKTATAGGMEQAKAAIEAAHHMAQHE